ncbi:MFS transporter [Nocardia wallacei]|uniref:MFS transporter n=1 Tax=Nocardia wallacei TaxID=480035 RepID=UPI002457A8F1|nr:MFS transporter [Nocardia wallacei]
MGGGGGALSCSGLGVLKMSSAGRVGAAALGLGGAVGGAGGAGGLWVGGLLTEMASWRWIFFVNLPVSVLAMALCAWVLAADEPPHRGRVDVAGTVTFTASAAAATYALIRANEHGWSNSGTWWTLAAAVAALGAFVVVERRSRQPMLDLALLRNRVFTGVLIAGTTLFFAAFGALMYTQIWMQSVLGLSPIEAGLVGLPLSVMAFVVSGGIGRYLHGPNPGRIIGTGLLLVGAGGVLGTALVHGEAGWAALIPGFLAIGAGVGLATATLGSAATSAVGWQRAGMATGALNTAQQLGFTIAIATLGSAFTARAGEVLADRAVPDPQAIARAVAGGQAPLLLGQLPAEAIRLGAAAGVQGTLAAGGIVGLLGAAAAFGLMRARRPGAVEPEPIPERSQV